MAMRDDYLVVCPYYVEDLPQEKTRRIACEGVGGAFQLRLVFDDRDAFIAHKRTYCRNMNRFADCPVCRILTEKYK